MREYYTSGNVRWRFHCTKNLRGGKERPVLKANLTALWVGFLEYFGAPTSHNPMVLDGSLQEHLHPFTFSLSCTEIGDRRCGLVVRVPGYRSRGPRLDSRRYQIF
jgi:hypothetical protein